MYGTDAYPTGAGSCPHGKPAVGGSHNSDTSTVTTGSLEDYNLQMKINGRILRSGIILTLQTGVEQAWSLSASSDVGGFRGFLIRLSGGFDEVDTTVVLSSADPSVKEAYAVCVVTQGVGGLTHTNRDPKNSISGILRSDESGRDLEMDVTVVVQNVNGESIYYYSAFTIDFIEREKNVNSSSVSAPTTTTTPVSLPTTSPTTGEQSTSPTFIATPQNSSGGPSVSLQTISPTGTNTESSSSPPTNSSTSSPTSTPQTILPTFPPSSSEGPTSRPSQQLTTSAPTTTPWPSSAMISSTPSPTQYLRASMIPTSGTVFDTTVELAVAAEEQENKDTNVLLPLVDVEGGCSPERPCTKCQGDCRIDSDCAGDLQCYQRPGDYGIPIPGCIGIGTLGNDYCYETSALVLRLRTPHCSKSNPCLVCEGDCNHDSDCQGDLKCFQRAYSDTSLVPGCDNVGFQTIPYRMRVRWTGLDYCYDPNFDAVAGEENTAIETNCNSDDDCLPIACFEEPCYNFVCRDSRCIFLEKCGPNECGLDEFCCNESCGTCAPIGSYCRQDECEPCGAETCRIGQTCCNPNCGICTPKGGSCPDVCSDHQEEADDNKDQEMVPCLSDDECVAPECSEEPCLSYVCRDSGCVFVEPCGEIECGPGEYCCSESCSKCEKAGIPCLQDTCTQCGDDVCVGEEICCGAGCGICRLPSGSCPDLCNTEGAIETGQVGGEGQGEDFDTGADNDDEGMPIAGVTICESDSDCTTPPCTEEPCMSRICFNSACVLVENCGRNVCDPDEYCCNPSCSICAPVGGYSGCHQGACEPCGDDEVCNIGDICCSPDCGICKTPGGSCPDICNTPTEEEEVEDITDQETVPCFSDEDCTAPACTGEPCLSYICLNSQCTFAERCGRRFCTMDEFCCNESCSMCVPVGGTCPKTPCGVECGEEVCNYGDTCCNPHCSICKAPGGSCPNICNSYWVLAETPSRAPSTHPSDAPSLPLSPAPTSTPSTASTIAATVALTSESTNEPIDQNDDQILPCTTDEECSDFFPCMTEPCPSFACKDSQCKPTRQACGQTECSEFEYCCSEACSICVPLDDDVGCDGMCQSVTEEDQENDSQVECEVTLDCPIMLCFEAQCPQIECRENKCLLYIPCGEIRCEETEICCCGSCAPKGTICDACEPCGSIFCPPGEVCCNESCSICTKPGGFCSAGFCFEDDDEELTIPAVATRKEWKDVGPLDQVDEHQQAHRT